MSSPILNLPELIANQAQPHIPVNGANRILEAVCQIAVIDNALVEPPADPEEGDRYIVAATAVDEWADQEDNVALYSGGVWVFIVPRKGWIAWVDSLDAHLCFKGAGPSWEAWP